MWLEHSKMLINEYRLDLMSEQGQRIWMTELEKFFFGEGAQLPAEYVAPKQH
jgi:Fe-S cluster biosynthesis and repair protein YggX